MPRIKKNLMTLEDALETFMINCTNKDLTKKTLNSYESTLKLFFKYLEKEFNIKEIEMVEENYIKEIRLNGGCMSDTATHEQVKKLNSKWAKKSIYLTEEIHDSKSIRNYIREYDKMKLDECIDNIVNIVTPMKGEIKHRLIDVAIKEG